MRLYFTSIILFSFFGAYAQSTYNDFVDAFKMRRNNMDLVNLAYFENVSSFIRYSCNDSVYNAEHCSKKSVWIFDNTTNTAFDTVFYTDGFEAHFGPFQSRRIEINEGFLKVNITSFDSLQHVRYSVDSILFDKLKNPLARYEDNVLKEQWKYDENRRLISYRGSIFPDVMESIDFVYGNNVITEYKQRIRDQIPWVFKYEYLFDAKSHYIVRKNVLKETVRSWHSDGSVTRDSLIVHEPIKPTHYSIYEYGPHKYKETEFDDGFARFKIREKYDRDNRVVMREERYNGRKPTSETRFTYGKDLIIKRVLNEDGSWEKTTKYLNDKGYVIKVHTQKSDPEVWETRHYNGEGYLTREIEFNHGKISMRIVEVTK